MFEKIISKIEQHDSIVIFGHLNPDGDCYGSQIALRAILKAQYPNKKIYAVGSGLKNFYKFLGQMDKVSLETIKTSLAVVLDSNDLTRLEDQRVKEALDFCKIDHHIDTFNFTEGPEVIDSEATSTSELIYDFAREHNSDLPEVACNALYLGIYTDTARFQYASNYVKMFEALKQLCASGAEPKKISALLNITKPRNLDIKSFIYQNIQKDEDGILFVVANDEQRRSLNATNFDITANTNMLAHVEGYPIWFVGSATESGGLQVEIRSNAYNVQKIATSFGGGGHIYAAGFTVKEFSEKVVEQLLEKCRETIRNGKVK